jgi:hypothetical protein
MRVLQVAIAIALAAACAGCETLVPTACDRTEEGNPPVRYTGGRAAGGVYNSAEDPDGGSSPWGEELLHFPGGMHYELEHHLGATPRWIQAYLSFNRYGTSEDGGSLAPAAGNQVVIQGADDMVIRVANDSCVDYWLLVTAGTGAGP